MAKLASQLTAVGVHVISVFVYGSAKAEVRHRKKLSDHVVTTPSLRVMLFDPLTAIQCFYFSYD